LDRQTLTKSNTEPKGFPGWPRAARLDAEEWRDLVGAYLDAASTAVTDMGGKVAKKLGDGLMALFGYPVASDERIGLSPIIHKRTLIGTEFLSRWTLTLPIQVC
jgi:hypothetical protein